MLFEPIPELVTCINTINSFNQKENPSIADLETACKAKKRLSKYAAELLELDIMLSQENIKNIKKQVNSLSSYLGAFITPNRGNL